MQNEANRLSIGKAAKYLGVSIDSLRRWDKNGVAVSHKSPGGHRYFIKSELDAIGSKKQRRTKQLITKPPQIVNTDQHKKNPVHPTLIGFFIGFLILDLILGILYIVFTH